MLEKHLYLFSSLHIYVAIIAILLIPFDENPVVTVPSKCFLIMCYLYLFSSLHIYMLI
jgi:hypothetical protein